jgi:SNF2 family DNA or RNA helicase
MLADRGIPRLRIDGRVSYSDRLEILSEFRDNPNIPVLLISIETGAVGYGS